MLADIPPFVLSEVPRDVDLFVGVASVSNDPNWADDSPQGRYRDYWHGDPSGTAKTQRDIPERLLPRLKIADRATLSDRFLVVRSDLRTYKIHLGSGNILMTPNDTYLCIVPRSTDEKASVFLPFEGDRILFHRPEQSVHTGGGREDHGPDGCQPDQALRLVCCGNEATASCRSTTGIRRLSTYVFMARIASNRTWPCSGKKS